MTFAQSTGAAVSATRNSCCVMLLAGFSFIPSAVAQADSNNGSTNEHWSFKIPERPPVPKVKQKRWPRNPIDNFILARLEQNKLAPAPEADRLTLIRRLSFDVIGLPPSPEEVDAFLADKSATAYEKLVDRLLASPRYGERWARHWLDVVRFAESNGYEVNTARTNAWPYRDYVIQALNEDRPYDRFVIEQLAGDSFLLDAPTGFIVGGAWDRVMSPDVVLKLQQRMDELHDMVSTTGSAFLGLTVGCARCHNHKFDPISQTDYYAMVAVFAGVQHGARVLRPPDYPVREAEAKQIDRRLLGVNEKLERYVQFAQVVPPTATTGTGSSEPPPGDTTNFAYLRPPVHPRRNLERFPPVEAKFVRLTILETTSREPCIDELEVFTAEEKPRNVALDESGAKPSASGTIPNSDQHRVEYVHDGHYGNDRSWLSNEQGKGWVQIELQDKGVINKIIWARDREGKKSDHMPTRYRIEVATDTNQWKVIATSDDRMPYQCGEEIPPPDYTAEGKGAEAEQELKQLLAQKEKEESRYKELMDLPKVFAGKLEEPQPTHRLFRGDVTEKREVVEPATLSEFGNKVELPANSPEAARRLALAKWIADPQNPLTARVMVNRIWQHHFGAGLVGTPSDFGRNGLKPTHPELLDWLATEFIARGWSIKQMHRLMLLSSTYRQSGKSNPRSLAVDTANRWLWRFPPTRLEAEPIRDAILAVSGKLNLKMGGPGFDLFEPNDNYVKVYNSRNDFGTNEWRRMVYQAKPRVQLDDTFGAFDCPDAGQIAPKRNASTTPLQALNLLHGPFLLQQSGFFAERLKAEAGDDPKAQARRAFRLAFGREATNEEIRKSVNLIKETGLQNFCRALFNANEFLYVY